MAESAPTAAPRVNVADRLARVAAERPDALAVVSARRRGGFDTISFAQLDREANALARGLVALGVRPGARLALLVKPSVEFVTLVFALLRSGATMVLVDAALGRKNIVRCLSATEPEGFVAIPMGHALRVLKRSQFPKAKLNVTVGRRWFWGGETLESLRRLGKQNSLPHTTADDPAAVVFTSGSTGPPKGVLYRHETFATQCDQIQRQYDIQPGAVDLACFPLFGLFNVACGVTTVLPDMDFSRPASCDPRKILAAASQWKCTQAFASPAVWDKLSRHCQETGERIPTLQKILSCGAPVRAEVIRRTLACVHPNAEMHTPYGATEALPVATIEAREILSETAAKTDEGAGVCVGRPFGPKSEVGRRKAEGFDWKIIRISDDPIASIEEAEELPTGEIGELIVRGPQVSREYLGEPEASAPGADHNAKSKITDGAATWHRMGDVGYFDSLGRFWYCGRKSHRVETENGTLYTECVEQVCNAKEHVEKTALVKIVENGTPLAVLVVDGVLHDIKDKCEDEMNELLESHPVFQDIYTWIMYAGPLPTDIRHNAKINRELLAKWAEKKIE